MPAEGLDVPLIVLSAMAGEEYAVELLKTGAHDFCLKDRMACFTPAVRREPREAEARRTLRRDTTPPPERSDARRQALGCFADREISGAGVQLFARQMRVPAIGEWTAARLEEASKTQALVGDSRPAASLAVVEIQRHGEARLRALPSGRLVS